MKKYNKDLELLSSYLDGELSQSEKKYIEDKIKTSLELQKELVDLKKLKELTTGSISKISDSPFFETRVLATINKNSTTKFSLKKWVPVGAITVLTLGLMILLKFNPDLINNLIEKQKSNIAGFYKENLQPLLYSGNLSNDDIFNFALYQQLPLDSANQQVLKLGNDPQGTEYFEIKKVSDLAETKQPVNLKTFIDVLDLDENETKQIDSIIGSYSDQITSLVLVNDKNSVAINPNIWNTRKAILADLLAFAHEHSAENLDRLLPDEIKKCVDKSVVSWVNQTKNNKADQYIFLTPDSIFNDNFQFDLTAFKENLKNMGLEFNRMEKEMSKVKNFAVYVDARSDKQKERLEQSEEFKVFVDTNFVKVTIQKLQIPDFNIANVRLPNLDSIAIIIEEATKNTVTVRSSDPSQNYTKKFNFEYNTKNKTKKKRAEVNLDSLMNLKNSIIDSVEKEVKKNLESSIELESNEYKNYSFDSLMMMQNQELKREMDNLKKELRRFREQMQNLDNNPNGNSNKSDVEEIKFRKNKVI